MAAVEQELGRATCSEETEDSSEFPLIKAVRNTRTLGGRFPLYRNATISLKDFDPKDLYPIAKYVIKANLRLILFIREQIRETAGVDIFFLDQLCECGSYTIAPPVVEISDNAPVIIDGLHRCYLAKELGEKIRVIFINGVDSNYPTISAPVSWDEVIRYQEKPEVPLLLRNIRNGVRDEEGSLRLFYRDFSYLGSSGRRPRLGQGG